MNRIVRVIRILRVLRDMGPKLRVRAIVRLSDGTQEQQTIDIPKPNINGKR